MADINLQAKVIPDTSGLRKSIEKELKGLSFQFSSSSYKQVAAAISANVKPRIEFTANLNSIRSLKSQISTALGVVPVKVKIELSDSKSSLQAVAKLTDELSKSFDKVSAAKDRFAANVDQKFPRILAHVQKLNAALLETNRGLQGNSQTARAAGGGGESRRSKKTVDTQAVADYEKQTSGATKRTKEFTDATDKATGATRGFAAGIGNTTQRLIKYLIPATFFFQFTRGLGAARDEIVQLNKDVIQLTQILTGNAAEANKLATESLLIAEKLGQSGTEIVSITKLLAQSGEQFRDTTDGLQEAVKALAASNLAATFGDINETVQGGIAYINQFGLEGRELIDVLDSANVLARDFAVEAGDLFKAVQTGGAAFASLGADFQEFQAVVTALRQLTRIGAASIGTGLNSIRLNLFTPENLEFIRDMGIGIEDTSGKLRSFVDIMKDIAAQFKNLDEATRAGVAEQLFGIRQAKFGLPLLTDLANPSKSVTLDALEKSKNAAGSIFRDAQIGLERIDVQFQRVITKFQEAFLRIVQNEDFTRFLSSVAKGLGIIADILGSEVFTTVLPSLLRVGSLFALGAAIKGVPNLVSGLRSGGGGSPDDPFFGPFSESTRPKSPNRGGLGSSAVPAAVRQENREVKSALAQNTSSEQQNTAAVKQLTNAITASTAHHTVSPTQRTSSAARTSANIVPGSLNQFLASQPAGMRQVMEQNIKDAITTYKGNFASSATPKNLVNDRLKFNAYRELAAEMGFTIGPGKVHKRSHTVTAPIFATPVAAPAVSSAHHIIPGRPSGLSTFGFSGPSAHHIVGPQSRVGSGPLNRQIIDLIDEAINQPPSGSSFPVGAGPATRRGQGIFGRTGTRFSRRLGVASSKAGRAIRSSFASGGGGRTALGFGLALGIDAIANQSQDLQSIDLARTDEDGRVVLKNRVQDIASENLQRASSRGALSGAASGAATGLMFGPVGVAIGATTGLVIGAIRSYNSALEENRNTLLNAASSAKTFSESMSAFAILTGDVARSASSGLSTTGTSFRTDLRKQLTSGPAADAFLQSNRRFAGQFVRQLASSNPNLSANDVPVIVQDQIREQIAKQIKQVNPGISDRTAAARAATAAEEIVKTMDDFIAETYKSATAQEALRKAMQLSRSSVEEFAKNLTQQIENIELDTQGRSFGNAQRGSFLSGLTGGFSGPLGIDQSFVSLATNRFKTATERGQLTPSNIGGLSLGVLSQKEQDNLLGFSSIRSTTENVIRDLTGSLEKIDLAGSLENQRASIRAAITSRAGAQFGGLSLDPTQRQVARNVQDSIAKLLEGNLEELRGKSPDELVKQIFGDVDLAGKSIDLFTAKLNALLPELDKQKQAYEVQKQVFDQFRTAIERNVSGQLGQIGRRSSIGVGTGATLKSLSGVLGQIGSSDVNSATGTLNQARSAYSTAVKNFESLSKTGGDVSKAQADVTSAFEQLNKAQNSYTNALQNSDLKLRILGETFQALQAKLNETLQTNRGIARASASDLVSARVGVAQANGLGLIRGLGNITNVTDLANANPQDLESLAKQLANVPDEIYENIIKGLTTYGNRAISGNGLTGNNAAELFDQLRGAGRLGDTGQNLADLQAGIQHLFDVDKEMFKLEQEQTKSLADIARNTGMLAEKMLGLKPGSLVPNQSSGSPVPSLPSPNTQPGTVTFSPSEAVSLNAKAAQVRLEEARLNGQANGNNQEFFKALEELKKVMEVIANAQDKTGSGLGSHAEVNLNVTGLEAVGKDTAAAAIVVSIMRHFMNNLDQSDPAQAKLWSQFNTAIKQIESGGQKGK